MALAKELMGLGFPGAQASGIGGQGGSLAALGTSLATGAPVTAGITIVTGADGTTGVTLVGGVGDSVWLFNNSASTLKVYGDASTVAISVAGTGLGSAGSAFSQLTYKATLYIKQSTTQWLAITSA